MTRKSAYPATLLLLLAVSACGPSGGGRGGGHGGFGGGHGGFGMHHMAVPLMSHALRLGMRETRPRGFRRACEDDAAKLCSGLTRRQERDCLQGKRAMLSTECREALDRRLERANRGNNEHTN
jgi:hypothetical protein